MENPLLHLHLFMEILNESLLFVTHFSVYQIDRMYHYLLNRFLTLSNNLQTIKKMSLSDIRACGPVSGLKCIDLRPVQRTVDLQMRLWSVYRNKIADGNGMRNASLEPDKELLV